MPSPNFLRVAIPPQTPITVKFTSSNGEFLVPPLSDDHLLPLVAIKLVAPGDFTSKVARLPSLPSEFDILLFPFPPEQNCCGFAPFT